MTEKAKIDAAFYTLMNDPQVWFGLDNLPHEVWRDVKNYEGLYQVSNMGRVRSFRGSKIQILHGHINLNGYVTVTFTLKGNCKAFFVHALVAQAFIPNPGKKDTVNHKRGRKSDNRVSELEWMTRSENMKHAFKIGLAKAKRKLSADDIRYIREAYKKGSHEFGAKSLARKFKRLQKFLGLFGRQKIF
ncbi:MAG: NUMOD4 motif-containing HNH endonuclease [Selenomonadaceae bacterium]|nr:NUMOD4 motif-containing HNH endonuclease [Selenomonadaceae bacterium]